MLGIAMGFKLYLFYCEKCSYEWEDLVLEKSSSCESCGQVSNTIVPIAELGSFSMSSPEDKEAKLRKRSADHTKREMRKHGKVL